MQNEKNDCTLIVSLQNLYLVVRHLLQKLRLLESLFSIITSYSLQEEIQKWFGGISRRKRMVFLSGNK